MKNFQSKFSNKKPNKEGPYGSKSSSTSSAGCCCGSKYVDEVEEVEVDMEENE